MALIAMDALRLTNNEEYPLLGHITYQKDGNSYIIPEISSIYRSIRFSKQKSIAVYRKAWRTKSNAIRICSHR